MAETLSPFVYWGQKNEHVSVKISLRELQKPQITLTENNLKFESYGLGNHGYSNYAFDMRFYMPVDPENSRYRVTDLGVEFNIKKTDPSECWPRLTETQMKYPWLKIDFDKFDYEDDSDEQEQDQDETHAKMAQKEMLDKMEMEFKDTEQAAKDDIKLGFLFLYNLFQFVGYTYVFIRLLYQYLMYGEDGKTSALETVGMQLMVVQLVSVLEIINPMLGLVKSGVKAPIMQFIGRNFVLFIVILQEPRLHEAPTLWYLFMVWSVIELIRYPYYMLSCIGHELRWLTWLRYTAWMPLYPLGILMEGTVYVMAIPLYQQSLLFSFTLPNSTNFAFYFPWFLRFYLLLLAGGGYVMLNHMHKQSKSKLSKTSKKMSKSKKT